MLDTLTGQAPDVKLQNWWPNGTAQKTATPVDQGVWLRRGLRPLSPAGRFWPRAGDLLADAAGRSGGGGRSCQGRRRRLVLDGRGLKHRDLRKVDAMTEAVKAGDLETGTTPWQRGNQHAVAVCGHDAG